MAQGGQGSWQQWEGGPDSPGCWQSFPSPRGHVKASLLLQKHISGSKESCVSSQGKASGKMGVMAHKKLFANQKTLTQTHHGHSTSWTKARAFHFKEDLAKESQILNNCIPTARIEKQGTQRARWNPTPPIFSHKSMGEGQALFIFVLGEAKYPQCFRVLQFTCSSPPKVTKTGKRDSLFLVVLKIQKGQIRNKSG